jgi:NAD(P)-dependent dehydrogenase (short-subunit alcohol dehydrogenase family)
MRDLRDKLVVITGAASGIGRATANAFAREHAKLVLCDVNEDGLREVEREVSSQVDHIEWRITDVSSRQAMRELAESVHERFPAVDVLVNNAGVGQSGGLLDMTLDDWEWVLSINLWGVIHGCHYFVPKMVEQRCGHVVNVSSVFGFFAPPGTLGYCTAKFGVFGFSESLRGELAPHGIGVSTICPGMINTNIVKTGRFNGSSATSRERAVQQFEQRGHSPDVVARAILSAVRKNRAVVPAAPEAWAFYYAKRFLPGQFDTIARAVSRRAAR